MGLFFAPNLTRQRKFYAAFFPNCGNPARPRSRINTVRESVMDSGITNKIESLSRLLPIQMIFSIIVYHGIINSILTSLNYCQSWIREIKKRYVSCLIDLMKTVFFHCFVYFWNCEQINPAFANGRTTLYFMTNITVGISCCIKKTVLTNVLKRKRIAKQNVIFSLELRSRLEILRALVLISTVSCSLNFHWTVFCLAARAWSCSTASGDIRIVQAPVLDLVSFIVHCCKGAFPLIFFFSLIGWNVLLISCRLKLS